MIFFPCICIHYKDFDYGNEVLKRTNDSYSNFASDLVFQSGHLPAVLVWDCATLAFICELKCHSYGVACMALSADGQLNLISFAIFFLKKLNSSSVKNLSVLICKPIY